MARPSKYTSELRRRAVDKVLDQDRTVIEVARSLGIATPESVRRWVIQARIDRGLVSGPTTEEIAVIKALKRRRWPYKHPNNRNFEGGNQFFCASGRPSAQVTVAFIDGHRDWFRSCCDVSAAGILGAHLLRSEGPPCVCEGNNR